MKVLILLGHVRAGKSTLASHALRSAAFRAAFPRAAWIQNDVPFHDGAAQAPEDVEFVGMNAGCFGCADASALIAHLRRLEADGTDLGILEPFGFMAGHELPEALHREGIPFKVMALASSDLASLPHVRQDIVESHLAVADLVLATHGLPSDGSPAFSLEDPEAGISLLLEMLLNPLPSRYAQEVGSLIDEPAGHDHPFTAVEFLRDGLARDELQAFVDSLPTEGLWRVKGSLGGFAFQAPLPERKLTWVETASGPRDALVVYAEEGYHMSELPKRLRRCDTASLLRASGGRSVEERTAALQSLVDQVDARNPGCMHTAQLDRDGRVVVYGEELEEINELRKDPEVLAAAPDLCAYAVDQRVRVALLGINQAIARPDLFLADSPTTERLAHYAVTVAYFAARQPWKIAHERLKEIVDMAADIARCWLLGIGRIAYPADAEKARTIAHEGALTARYLISLLDDEELRGQIRAAAEAQRLAAAPAELRATWSL